MAIRRYEKKISNPPEPPKALFKPEPSRENANPPRLGEDKMFKNYCREKTPASKELREKLRELTENNITGEDNMGTKFDIVVDLLKKDRITRNESRILLSEDSEGRKMTNPEANSSMRNKLTNSFNNQFILQSNSSTHKSSYQCVVCGSFNVSLGVPYADWYVAKKTITCGDCNNKFSKKE